MISSRPSKKNLLYAAAALIVAMGIISWYSWPDCSRVQFVDASITVKTPQGRGMLGFNADTDSLKFGVVSPGIQAQRKLYLQQQEHAEVEVAMLGQLAGWTAIEPSQFTLPAEEKKEISVAVQVPINAVDGNYTGKVRICFRE